MNRVQVIEKGGKRIGTTATSRKLAAALNVPVGALVP